MKTSSKLPFMFMALAGVGLLTDSCSKKEEPQSTALSATTIQNNWKVTESAGTEWKKGTGVITPKANDPGTVGFIITIDATTATVKQGSATLGSFSYTLDVAASTILVGPDGNTGLGFFKITEFVAGQGMKWEQREPIDADYKTVSSGNQLYFQKFFTIKKE